MQKKLFFTFGGILLILLWIQGLAQAAPSFFEGKTVRIIVGYSAGGGFDINSRIIARHIGKYLPGRPTVIVENMTGAGGLILANHLYKVAKPDGLTIGHFIGYLVFNQVLGEPGIEFDAGKFVYLGAAMQEHAVIALSKASGITTVDKWLTAKTPVKLGGVAPGNSVDNNTRIIKAALGLPIQLVSGYKGTSDIRLAVENGELAGVAYGWDSMKSSWQKAIERGDIVPVVQAAAQPFPDIPKVPLAISYAKNDEARKLIEIGLHSSSIFSRPFALPPGTPKDRVQILRKAFQDTMKDKEFLAEMAKANMGLEPVTGEELEKHILGVYKLEPAFLAKLKTIMFK